MGAPLHTDAGLIQPLLASWLATLFSDEVSVDYITGALNRAFE